MFLITHTRSVDPSPQKNNPKKKEGGGCDSGGAPSGVPPFPPPPKKRTPPKKRDQKQRKKGEKKERGGGLDAPFVWLSPGWHSTAIVLIPLVVFAHACELHPVSYVSFPCTREKKKKRDEDTNEWCSMRLTTHMNASTRNPLVAPLTL